MTIYEQFREFAGCRRGTAVAFDFVVLESIRGNPGVALGVLVDITLVKPNTLRSALGRLVDRGLIRRELANGCRSYTIKIADA